MSRDSCLRCRELRHFLASQPPADPRSTSETRNREAADRDALASGITADSPRTMGDPMNRALSSTVTVRDADTIWHEQLYVIDGRVALDGDPLRTRDAARITGRAKLRLTIDAAAELILIDVPLAFERIGVWAGGR